MANKSLFKNTRGSTAPAADTVNEAGGLAYKLSDKAALSQYVATGCFGNTFYASAKEELKTVLALAHAVEPEFLAKLAVYARGTHMKDTPALLLAVLATKSPEMLRRVFSRVIDNGKMLRNYVQIVRSGQTGRKSLGTAGKRLIQRWLIERPPHKLFRDSVGDDPRLRDIMRMVHATPKDSSQESFWSYLVGKEKNPDLLPELVKSFESFKKTQEGPVPEVSWEMLTALPLKPAHWKEIAQKAGWQMLRMNLNTFKRHGVLEDKGMVALIADRLRSHEEIAKARVFPYQLMMAYMAAEDMPREIDDALQGAMETAIENVPELPGKTWVFPDVSGSMHSPVTGGRGSATSKVQCVHVAGLVAAAVLRKNPGAGIIPFHDQVVDLRVNPRDSVMTNAHKFATCGSGGTDCSAPLQLLNLRKETGDTLIYVSDNQSWVDSWENAWMGGAQYATGTMQQWRAFKARNPKAKLVCIDLQPNKTAQVKEGEKDVLQVGGFSDRVFDIVKLFAQDRLGADHWVGVLDKTEI